MTNEEFNAMFREKTKAFAIGVIKFIETVPFNSATRVMNFQLCKAATSVGANHRAFCRGRSKNERFSKICIVVEEADESQFWLEIFDQLPYGDKELLAWLMSEITEIVKVSTSIKNSTFPH
ncbi:MAG: four helix bundle protein [Saprospiraceae bacterium]|nr:four helix bundle protein [Saprospiraceae bacterium]